MKKNHEAVPTHLGASIRKARTERGLSQQEVGKLLGVKRATVSLWETGRSISPLSLTALRGLFGDSLIEPSPPPDAASLAFWRTRVVQLAHQLRAVLAEQEALASDMAGAYAADPEPIEAGAMPLQKALPAPPRSARG